MFVTQLLNLFQLLLKLAKKAETDPDVLAFVDALHGLADAIKANQNPAGS